MFSYTAYVTVMLPKKRAIHYKRQIEHHGQIHKGEWLVLEGGPKIDVVGVDCHVGTGIRLAHVSLRCGPQACESDAEFHGICDALDRSGWERINGDRSEP